LPEVELLDGGTILKLEIIEFIIDHMWVISILENIKNIGLCDIMFVLTLNFLGKILGEPFEL